MYINYVLENNILLNSHPLFGSVNSYEFMKIIDMETEYFRQLDIQGWLISTVLIVRTRTNSCCVEMLGKVLFSLLLLLGPCKGEHLSICNREVKPNVFFQDNLKMKSPCHAPKSSAVAAMGWDACFHISKHFLELRTPQWGISDPCFLSIFLPPWSQWWPPWSPRPPWSPWPSPWRWPTRRHVLHLLESTVSITMSALL